MDMDARPMEIKTLIPLLALMALWGCGGQGPKISNVRISADSLPAQEFFGETRLSLTEKNKKLWSLTTTHILKYRKGNHTYLDPVDIIYFTRDGRTHLKADSGVITGDMDTLRALGKITIRTFDKKEVTTSQIAWYKKTDKVASDRYVRMVTSEGDVYTGTGFIANTDLTEWKILKNVKAKINDLNRAPMD